MKFRLVEEQVEYNANPFNKNEGDCTIRALSLAYDKNYNVVKSELVRLAKSMKSEFNYIDTVKAFIDNNGYQKFFNNEKSNLAIDTVDDFIRMNHNGVYVIYCSNKIKQNNSNSFHLVCAINGKLYDTWDPSDYYVLGAWKIKNSSRTVHNIDESLYNIDSSDINKLSSNLYNLFMNLFNNDDFEQDSQGSYISKTAIGRIINNNSVYDIFKNYSGLADNIIEYISNIVFNTDTLKFQDDIKYIIDQYTDDFLNGRIE